MGQSRLQSLFFVSLTVYIDHLNHFFAKLLLHFTLFFFKCTCMVFMWFVCGLCVLYLCWCERYVWYVCILRVVYVCVKYMPDVIMCNVWVWNMCGVCVFYMIQVCCRCGICVVCVSYKSGCGICVLCVCVAYVC